MVDQLLVKVCQGTLRGAEVTSTVTKSKFYCFKGIPYAKPPVGPLRFRPPEPPESWKGVRNALKERNISCQYIYWTDLYLGDEDSLFLNIYTKTWPPSEPKAVMVFIHGGGFAMGSGDSNMLGPDYLMTEDVIFITLNFRLGVLGFLHVDGTDVTTNNCFRDVVAALLWIKENITCFGGDPTNVTLFGSSSGGILAQNLLFAPSAKGLFHRLILQSGSALCSSCNMLGSEATEKAFRLGKALGCKTNDPQELVDYFRSLPANKIVLAQESALSEEEKLHLMTSPFIPVVEESSKDNSFIPGNVMTLLQEGKFHHVPLLCGVTTGEGKFLFQPIFHNPSLSQVNENFERAFAFNLIRVLGKENFKAVAQKIRNIYFGNKIICESEAETYAMMEGDIYTYYPLYKTIVCHVQHQKLPVYLYVFSKTEPQNFSLPGSHPKVVNLSGATHGADSFYMFHSVLNLIKRDKYSPEERTTKYLVKVFTNFCRTGNPSEGLAVEWPSITQPDKFPCVDIGGKLRAVKNFDMERIKVLDTLFITANGKT